MDLAGLRNQLGSNEEYDNQAYSWAENTMRKISQKSSALAILRYQVFHPHHIIYVSLQDNSRMRVFALV